MEQELTRTNPISKHEPKMENNNPEMENSACSEDELQRKEGEAEKKEQSRLQKLLKDTDSKRGVVYLSRIPSGMSVKLLRDRFEVFGTVDRIYLQPDERQKRRKKCRIFTEGWLEFEKKRCAKNAASTLNNTQVGGRKRHPWYWDMWNVKYLSKFKWGHLNERFEYEKAVHSQRLRTEIAQVKRKTNHYIENIQKNQKRRRLAKKGEDNTREWEFKQAQPQDSAAGTSDTDARPSSKSLLSNKHLLLSIFSGGKDDDEDDDV